MGAPFEHQNIVQVFRGNQSLEECPRRLIVLVELREGPGPDMEKELQVIGYFCQSQTAAIALQSFRPS